MSMLRLGAAHAKERGVQMGMLGLAAASLAAQKGDELAPGSKFGGSHLLFDALMIMRLLKAWGSHH